VLSFDYNPDSVHCGLELEKRFFLGDGHWRIVEGSVLDEPFPKKLGAFSIVILLGSAPPHGRHVPGRRERRFPGRPSRVGARRSAA